MKATRIEEFEAPQPVPEPLQDVTIVALAKPEATGRAEMLEGSVEEVAGKLCELLAERGLL